jgi:hypothetical protein
VNYVNLTPHAIALNDGRVYPASGSVARVTSGFSAIVDDVCTQTFGDVQGLPDSQAGVRYIVSAMVLSALSGTRDDVVAPATGHPDTVRNDKGHIVSVPCFVR